MLFAFNAPKTYISPLTVTLLNVTTASGPIYTSPCIVLLLIVIFVL